MHHTPVNKANFTIHAVHLYNINVCSSFDLFHVQHTFAYSSV